MEMQGLWIDRGQSRELDGAAGGHDCASLVALSRTASLDVSATPVSCWLVLRGEATVESRDGQFPLHAGDWIVLERDSRPSVYSERNGLVLGALLPASLLAPPPHGTMRIALHAGRGRMDRREARQTLQIWRQSGLFAEGGRSLHADTRQLLPLMRHLMALQREFDGLIDRCPGRSLQRKQHVFARMQRARLYLEGNLERAVRITELARLSNVSIWYFSKTFHALYGEGPQAAIARFRQQRAAHLLRHARLSVSEVAAACGFDNNCSFSRAFRSHHGMPPSAYRILNGDFQVSDNIEAYAEVAYQNTRSQFQLAAEAFDTRPAFANIVVSKDSIYNPFGVDISDLRLRLVNVGPRESSFETNNFRSVLGLKGGFGGSSWSWDLGWVHGRVQQTSESHGELFRSKIEAALGPSFIDSDGTPRCGTPTTPLPGCTPVNFFGPPPAPGSAEFLALQAIAPYFHDRGESDINLYYAGVTGDLFDMPAGAAQIAVGVEATRETSEFVPDALVERNPITGECETSGGCSSSSAGKLDRKEIYAELYLPILADAPFAERLALTLGSRYSDYSAFGETTNSKLGFEWKPFSDLLVRGTFAEVFRSPTMADLFSGLAESADQYTDPCNGTTTNPNNACQNVPLDGSYNQSDTQLQATQGGNPDLRPESGWVRTLGFVYSPGFAEGVSLALDYWQVKLENNIGQLGSSNILQACYNSGNFCDRFRRGSDGEIAFLDNRLSNPGRVDTKGVDISVKYQLPDTRWGKFRASLDTTYTARYDRAVIVDGIGVVDFDDFAGEFADTTNGGDGHFARWRALGNLDWSYGDWSANYGLRYIHHVDEQAKYAGGLLVGPEELRVPSVTYHDLALSYTFKPSLKVTLGVENVTDKTAPLIFGGFNGSTDVRTYDVIGRFFFVRAEARF